MKCLKILGLLLATSSIVLSMSLGDSTARSAFKQLEVISSSKNDESNDVIPSSIDMLDVRTPPKIKQQQENFHKHFPVEFESLHAGIAIPVVDEVILEDHTSPKSVDKSDRSTTTSTNGLSTWILLSGQSSGTTKSPTKKVIKPVNQKLEVNETLVVDDKPHRIVKPIFKKRSTTIRPSTTTTKKNPSTKLENINKNQSTTAKPQKITNKVKASVFNNAISKKNHTILVKKTNTTSLVAVGTTHKPLDNNITTTILPKRTITKKTVVNKFHSSSLPVEAKHGESELPAEDKKKNKNKKKKNKNRRRKPSKEHKEDTSDLEAIKPASTQLYSYLRSEIIPVTVGVSLVGLLVTAGLASYYLQPFGLLRRSDSPIDRKDPPGEYYYQDQYSGGIPEEDAIGKVIAGMPKDVLQGTSFKSSTTRSSHFVNTNKNNNIRYRHVDRRSQIHMKPYGTVEDVKLGDQTMYSSNQNQYVVGNVQKHEVQEVTPAAVPEHGPRKLQEERKFVVGNLPQEYLRPGVLPRSLKIRRRRDIANETENEINNETAQSFIDDKLEVFPTTTGINSSTTENLVPSTVKPSMEILKNETANAIINLFTDIFRLKLQLGLELVQNITKGVNSYLTAVENKLNQYNETISNSSMITPNARNFLTITKRLRIRRDTMVNDIENEIIPEDHNNVKHVFTTTDQSLTENSMETSTDNLSTTTSGIWHVNEKRPTVMELLKELFRTKLRMGLEFIGTVSRTVSTYVGQVQSRLNERYRGNSVEGKEGSKLRGQIK